MSSPSPAYPRMPFPARLLALALLTSALGATASAQSEAPKPDAGATPATEAREAPKPEAPASAEPKPQPEPAPVKDTPPPAPKPPSEIIVGSWGGAYTAAQTKAYFAPFAAKTGIRIKAVRHPVAGPRLQSGDGDAPDVVDIGSAELATACRDGKLEPLDQVVLAGAADGARIAEDFLEGALTKCGVASSAWSHLLAYDRRAFAKRPPSKLADIFDLKAFPGRRALRRNPRFLLEMALLADGVKAADVYPTLSKPDGIERALAKLASLSTSLTWWEKGDEPARLLATGKAAIVAVFSGRIFHERQRGLAAGLIWDGQVYDLAHWAIPASARHKQAARDFIGFASTPSQMAVQARWLAYGPTRRSAIALVGRHETMGVMMRDHLPTAGNHLATALRFDAVWWQQHGAGIDTRFKAWLDELAKKQAATRTPAKTDRRAGKR